MDGGNSKPKCLLMLKTKQVECNDELIITWSFSMLPLLSPGQRHLGLLGTRVAPTLEAAPAVATGRFGS